MEDYILVIGGTNVDIQGYSYSDLIFHDSNPGKVEFAFGGVSKNMAENMAYLDMNIKFITVLGDDIFAKNIQQHLTKANIDMSNSLFLKNHSTSMYLSVLNVDCEMEVAISSMDICDLLDENYLKSQEEIMKKAKIIVTETNLTQNTLIYIANFCKTYNIPLVVDTVSTKKAVKILDYIGYFHTIKPNKIEAEILSGMKITNDDDLIHVGNFFLSKGVKNIFITLGSKGVFYMNAEKNGYITNPAISPVNVTGAGDSFVSAVTYGLFHELPIDISAKYGIAAALITIMDKQTVSSNMSINHIKQTIKERNI